MLDNSLSNIALLGRLSTYIIAHCIISSICLGYLDSRTYSGLLPPPPRFMSPLLRFIPPLYLCSVDELDAALYIICLSYSDSRDSCGTLTSSRRLMPPLPRDYIARESDAALYIIGIAIYFVSDLALLIGIAHAILLREAMPIYALCIP